MKSLDSSFQRVDDCRPAYFKKKKLYNKTTKDPCFNCARVMTKSYLKAEECFKKKW